MKNNMKKYILAIFSLLVIWTAAAQNRDETVFRAMETELQRNMDSLRMDDLGQPFWIGYIYCDIRVMTVAASLGEVVQSQTQPQRINATRVLFGGYATTSDINYNSAYNIRGSAIGTDEGQIRREFWLNTDANYKQTAPNMARKTALRRQSARTPEEEALPDLLPVAAIEKTIESPIFGFDAAEWERRTAELSAVFAKYPSLYGSEVRMSAYDWTNYEYTSEAVRTRCPSSFASLSVKASVRTPDGEEFADNIEIFATSDMTLPPQEELLGRVEDFASGLSEFAAAPKIEEFYSGPVLFVGQPVFRMFDDNLLPNNGDGLLIKRRNESQQSQRGVYYIGGTGGGAQPSSAARRLENRVGQRVLDRKFTVTNHSAMEEYKGVPLLGYYEVDADGVVPEASLAVIESGMLRRLLNGRIPTLKTPASTGSNRFSINITPIVAPGTLEVSASETKPGAELEKELVALAKADGLKYAYVVEKMSGKVNMVWRIDAATGERTLVRNAEVTPVALAQLKRVAGVSAESQARNYLAGQVPASMIYPSAVLMEDVEIGEMETTKEKPSPIVNPLQRIDDE